VVPLRGVSRQLAQLEPLLGLGDVSSTFSIFTPARSASFSTASVKLRFSSFITNLKASPPSPQPKQW